MKIGINVVTTHPALSPIIIDNGFRVMTVGEISEAGLRARMADLLKVLEYSGVTSIFFATNGVQGSTFLMKKEGKNHKPSELVPQADICENLGKTMELLVEYLNNTDLVVIKK